MTGKDCLFAMNELPKIVAGLLAIVALAASLLNGIDPIQCMIRGGIAWMVGLTAGTIWNLFFMRPAQSAAPTVLAMTETADNEEEESESKEAA